MLRAIVEQRDPLAWAKQPKSQAAADLLKSGVSSDRRLAEIFHRHVKDGVFDEAGNLVQRWDGRKWAMVSDEVLCGRVA